MSKLQKYRTDFKYSKGRFYSEIFFPYLDQHNIKSIIHLGDYFDRRRDVNFYSLYKNREHFVQPILDRNISMDLIIISLVSFGSIISSIYPFSANL